MPSIGSPRAFLTEALGSAGERPVERLRGRRGGALVARVERRRVGIPAALLVVQPAHQVVQIGVVQDVFVGPHIGAAVADLVLDGLVVDAARR